MLRRRLQQALELIFNPYTGVIIMSKPRLEIKLINGEYHAKRCAISYWRHNWTVFAPVGYVWVNCRTGVAV